MMKAKKILACMLALILLLSITACGGNPSQGNGPGNQNNNGEPVKAPDYMNMDS